MHRLIAAVTLGLVCGCDSPVTPRPAPLPPATVPQTRLSVSGMVTDENGAPVAGASIGLSHTLGAASRFRTSTNADGRYEFDFPEELSPPSYISAHALDASNFLWLDWGATKAVVKHIRLRRPANVYAGQSVVVSFEQDSSMCVWEWSVSDNMSCEYFIVTVEAPGVVTVEAHPIHGGEVPVSVGWENPGSSERFSQRIDSAGRLWMNLSVPRGLTPRYEIRTRFAR